MQQARQPLVRGLRPACYENAVRLLLTDFDYMGQQSGGRYRRMIGSFAV